MKTLYTLLLLVCFLFAQAQVTITNRTAPAAGDSFYYAIDSFAPGVEITPPGPNQSWDFSLVSPVAFRADVYKHAHQGINAASFPTADLVSIQGINEWYYKVYPNRIELLGTATRAGGTIPGVGAANVYPNPVVIQRYPENYLDSLHYETNNSIALSAAVLPDTLINSLPPALKPDSFRINYNTMFSSKADAWGKLQLPAMTWNVLREKRITESQITADAKVSFFGWVDVTDLVAPYFPGFFENFVQTSYAFVSNETKGLIALVNTDSSENVIAVHYKPDNKIVLKTNNEKEIVRIGIFPNPVAEEVYFSLPTNNPANYQLSIYNNQGQLISNQQMFIRGNETYKLNISHLSIGSYYLQFANEEKKYASEVFLKQ